MVDSLEINSETMLRNTIRNTLEIALVTDLGELLSSKLRTIRDNTLSNTLGTVLTIERG